VSGRLWQWHNERRGRDGLYRISPGPAKQDHHQNSRGGSRLSRLPAAVTGDIRSVMGWGEAQLRYIADVKAGRHDLT
jgi:hypothetical protein